MHISLIQFLLEPASVPIRHHLGAMIIELAACLAILFFLGNVISSIVYLKLRSSTADALAAASTEAGLALVGVSITGSLILTRANSDRWWSFDVITATEIVAGAIYISYLLVRRFAVPGQSATLSAVIAIFAFADIPITYAFMRFASQRRLPVVAAALAHIRSDSICIVAILVFLSGLLLMRRYCVHLGRTKADERDAAAAGDSQNPGE